MKNSDAEERLLNNLSLDELIKMKIEKEFVKNMKAEKPEIKTYTSIKNLPKEKIFSKNTVFKCYCKLTGCESYINGIQADAMIGLQNDVREKMLKGELDAFTTEDSYIKFENAVL